MLIRADKFNGLLCPERNVMDIQYFIGGIISKKPYSFAAAL